MTSHTSLASRYQFAMDLAKQAGKIALEFQQQLKSRQLVIEHKGVQDFVTEADKTTERHIRNELEHHFPEDAFLGEETGGSLADKDRGTWVVDPIDGTTNYLRDHALWCISIAYVVNGEPVIGVIFAPVANEMFHACKNQGAFLNGTRLEMNTSSDNPVGLVNLGYSRKGSLDDYLTTMKRLLDKGIEHRRHGSAALALAHTACGRFDGYRESFINAWDVFAGIVIVREAKGWVELVENDPGLAIAAGINSIRPLLSLDNTQ